MAASPDPLRDADDRLSPALSRKPHDVLATREVRAQLPALARAVPRGRRRRRTVVIGARRRPEAVVLSYERYLQLAGGRKRVAAALEQQAREAGART